MFFVLFCFVFFFSFVVFLIQFHQNAQHNGMKLLPTEKEKKHTFLFAIFSNMQSLVLSSWTQGNFSNFLFREELFVSLISVKFAIHLSLLQPSFQGSILLFLRSVSLSFRREGEDPGNEVVFTAESNIKPSCNLVTNLVKYYPILQKTAIGQ